MFQIPLHPVDYFELGRNGNLMTFRSISSGFPNLLLIFLHAKIWTPTVWKTLWVGGQKAFYGFALIHTFFLRLKLGSSRTKNLDCRLTLTEVNNFILLPLSIFDADISRKNQNNDVCFELFKQIWHELILNGKFMFIINLFTML